MPDEWGVACHIVFANTQQLHNSDLRNPTSHRSHAWQGHPLRHVSGRPAFQSQTDWFCHVWRWWTAPKTFSSWWCSYQRSNSQFGYSHSTLTDTGWSWVLPWRRCLILRHKLNSIWFSADSLSDKTSSALSSIRESHDTHVSSDLKSVNCSWYWCKRQSSIADSGLIVWTALATVFTL